MTPAKRAAHRAIFGHTYRLKRRPDNGKAYCGSCHSRRNTVAFSERYAIDPAFRARHNATALKGIRRKRSTKHEVVTET